MDVVALILVSFSVIKVGRVCLSFGSLCYLVVLCLARPRSCDEVCFVMCNQYLV